MAQYNLSLADNVFAIYSIGLDTGGPGGASKALEAIKHPQPRNGLRPQPRWLGLCCSQIVAVEQRHETLRGRTVEAV